MVAANILRVARQSAIALSLVFAGCICTGAIAQQTIPNASIDQPISVRDLVEQSTIGDPNTLIWNDDMLRVSAESPDGAHAAVVVRRGNADRETNEADLLIYKTSELLDRPTPRKVASFASTSNYQPIALVKWLADSSTLVFAGTSGSQVPQLYRVSVIEGKLTQLTQEARPLEWFDVTPSGEFLVTVRDAERHPPAENSECRLHGCLVTQETLYGAERGESETSYPFTWHDLGSGISRSIAPADATDPDLIDCKEQLAGGLSPDGRFGVQVCKRRVRRWPAWWEDYTADPESSSILKEGQNWYFRQLLLLDFERATSARITQAPIAIAQVSSGSALLWIDGGRHLVIGGALEPLNNATGIEKEARASHYAILVLDPRTGHIQRLARLDAQIARVLSVQWDPRGEVLTVSAADKSSRVLPDLLYQRRGEQWKPMPMPRRQGDQQPTFAHAHLVVHQSLNEPPKLVAVAADGKREGGVLDPNPWLSARKLARVEPVTWTSKDGRQWRGGLYYPPQFSAGTRYPVVLQTHGFNAEQFSMSGETRNFIAQPLAGAGFLVLQIDENTSGASALGSEEWKVVQAGYEAAVDYLDQRSLIDRQRVGVVGWSRSGSYLGYTLTHSTYDFAAAAFTDTADIGWWWYLLQGARHGETAYGVPPLGKGLDVWREMSPSFNLEHEHTPLLMWTGGVQGMWDWYAITRRLGKPVEYWVFPDASHEAFKIGERLHTGELLLDWFRFWLKAEEDPAPNKQAQYQRWHELRERWAASKDVTTNPSH
jgi:dipeptidyl aminopeptidase/acylaminoacyl peptidase